MPKFKQSYESCRKYPTDWEKEFPWLTKATGGSENEMKKDHSEPCRVSRPSMTSWGCNNLKKNYLFCCKRE